MLRACEKTACTKDAEQFYIVNGPQTGFNVKKMALCDTCPHQLREEAHLVTPAEMKP